MLNLELDDEDPPLRVSGVRDVTDEAADRLADRFPDLAIQIGGFVLEQPPDRPVPTDPDVVVPPSAPPRIRYVRWVPARRRPVRNAWDAATETLAYHVPERSEPFLRDAIEAAVGQARDRDGDGGDRPGINVLLLLGPRRYDVGSFDAVCYEPPLLILRRRGTEVTTPVAEPTPGRAPTPSGAVAPAVDSQLEARYHELFLAWGLETNYGRVMYHLEEAVVGAPGVHWYTPSLGGTGPCVWTHGGGRGEDCDARAAPKASTDSCTTSWPTMPSVGVATRTAMAGTASWN